MSEEKLRFTVVLCALICVASGAIVVISLFKDDPPPPSETRIDNGYLIVSEDGVDKFRARVYRAKCYNADGGVHEWEDAPSISFGEPGGYWTKKEASSLYWESDK